MRIVDNIAAILLAIALIIATFRGDWVRVTAFAACLVLFELRDIRRAIEGKQ